MKTITHFFFRWKFFGNWDQYLIRTMHTKVKFHESHFFFCFFFLPLFSYSSFLGKTDFYRELLFFGLFSLFSDVVSRDFECFYCCNVTENRRSNWTFGSLTMEIKIMKNGFRLLWAFKQNCFFFFLEINAPERTEIAQKSFTESLTRSSSLW